MEIFGAIMGMEIFFFLFVLFLGLILPLLALIDIVKSDFEGNNKLIWALIVVFVNFIGAILYFAIGRNQKI